MGLSREEVRDRIFGQVRPEIFRAVVAQLGEEGEVAAERDALRLASHHPADTGSAEADKNTLEGAFKSSGLQARTLEEAAASAGSGSSMLGSSTICLLRIGA
jgi:selenocysteine-specific elongation SelB-like protein